MDELRFFRIDDGYIEFLHLMDKRVQFNKNSRRPYIGVVLTVGDTPYYVPLESPKPNHVKIQGGGPVLKLDDGKLGIMGTNNMIPVNEQYLIDFDINQEQRADYKALLRKQLSYCNKNKVLIKNRASSTYDKRVRLMVPFYVNICCDFERLENCYMRYCKPKR